MTTSFAKPKTVRHGQIWWKNYAPHPYSLLVRVRILIVNEEFILSEIISSSLESRPIGMILQADLNGAQPIEHKTQYGWVLETESPETLVLN